MKTPQNIQHFKKSVGHAADGLIQTCKGGRNFRIHILAAVIVIAAGIARHITATQWLALCIVIGLVLVTEALNTAIEQLCDFCCDNKWHPAIKKVKDIAAGAVLLAAILSVIVGIIIFIF